MPMINNSPPASTGDHVADTWIEGWKDLALRLSAMGLYVFMLGNELHIKVPGAKRRSEVGAQLKRHDRRVVVHALVLGMPTGQGVTRYLNYPDASELIYETFRALGKSANA